MELPYCISIGASPSSLSPGLTRFDWSSQSLLVLVYVSALKALSENTHVVNLG